ncbi:MAG: MBL fold metallo-hydrolase [Actinobacteria bacterium]|nr:MBL fold metallo-hydrolase [Actinomycetota bacterium]
MWVDAGSGTLANLQTRVDLGEIDALVLSHEHPDHWTDLEGFHNILRFVLFRQGFPVYAPAGLKEHTYDDMAPWVEWNDVAEGDHVTVGTLELTFSRTDHGPETLGMRIDSSEAGRSVGYSADTGPGWSLEALGSGLDMAVCEATVPSVLEGAMQHLSARQAGESARTAGAKRLVLTHLWPTLDLDQSRAEGSEAFGSAVEVASVGGRYEL